MNNRARNTALGNIFITMVAVGSYVTFSLYILPLSKALNVTVGQISIMFSIAGFSGLFGSLFLGKILDTINIKKVIVFSGVMFFFFFFFISTAESIWLIYLGGFLSGLCQVFSGYPIAQVSVNWWFKKNTGKLMSMFSIGGGLAGIIMVQLAAQWIETIGFQRTALIQGIFVSGVVILSGLFLVSNHPKKYINKSIGDNNLKKDNIKNKTDILVKNKEISSFTKIPEFWMILTASFFISISITGFVTHASVYFQSTGLNVVQAALCVSAYSFARLGFAPFYGVIVDKRGPGFSTVIYGSLTASIFFISVFLNGIIGGVLVAVFVAASASMAGMLGAISFNKIFGSKDASHLVGFSHAAVNIGGIIGSPLAGYIYDYFGNYNLFMVIAGICMVLTVSLVYKASRKKINL